MPEATVHEEGKTQADQHNVRFSGQIGPVQPKSHTTPVERTTKSNFRLSVSGSLPGHERAYGRRGCGRTLGRTAGRGLTTYA